ncbi:hypothetical protein GY065_12370 [Snodgrassella sp. ESL0323]|uniref:YobI family P-loop NTPase n=1 Tax=Snodgrassella sp. ESL0323 TaxID=2705034 RepID=UPI0015818724|nr:hypothetical protein [Snodgrassella sp. ESL0323]NUF79692.1 hypothetical protein [Snodgrassella sp. ESL0323]
MSDVKHKSWCKKIYGWWLKAKNKSKESKSSSEQNEKAEYEYQKLTPYTEVDLKESKRAFDYVFQHDDVRNIAISGAYGSGKSSLIESYKKYLQTTNTNRKLGRKFLHISLAHFRTENNYLSAVLNEEANSQNENNELSLLEAKILNQLIHQISSEQIPQSNFAVKRITSIRDLLAITVSSIIFLLFMLDIIFSATWKEFVLSLEYSGLKELLLGFTTKIFLLSSAIWSMGLFAIFLYYIIKIQKYKNIFRKLKFQGNEIEIVTESSDSFFDKYLNEVIYIFVNANVDVIVFEDIDRFENVFIFERLREINLLANNQLKEYQKKKAKILRFFYLLRDDIFCTKDRTKFFDFIIPVVPVVDGSNSYDQLITFLKTYIDGNKIEKGFLEGISLYIDDMRLLKNICNEFHMYYSNINNTELNANKMFALIVYKNLFPLDFSYLQINQGYVYLLLNNKLIVIQARVSKLKKNIQDIRKTCKNEIKKLYTDLQNINTDDENDVNIEEEKKQKEKEINKFYEDKIKLLQMEITNYQNREFSFKSEKLKDYIHGDFLDINKFFNKYAKYTNDIGKENNFEDIKDSPYFALLKYLIRNGYIDETYADYMTYFYPNSLTIADKTYLRSIMDEIKKEYEYKLNNPKLVIGKLKHQISYFSKPEILNVDLVNYLLTYSGNYTKELKAILCQFSTVENIKFINVFWPASSKENLQKFVNLVNEYLPEFFKIAVNSTIDLNHILKDFSLITLYCLSPEIIIKINEYDNCLSNYIANSSDYLNIAAPDVEQLVKQFLFLKIKFAQIKYETANKDLFNEVYNNSLYKLNFANIKLMLSTQYSIVDEQDIIHRNYSCVQNKPDSPLAAYIAQNIDVYLHLILANCKQKISDNETEVLYLLNHDDISQEHKLEYIKYLQTPITSLDKVENTELWQNLLCPGKLAYNEENILCYFQHIKETDESVDENLIEFINSNETRLDFKDEDEEVRDEFFDVIIINQKINNYKYKEILSTLGFHYEEFDIENIAINKFKILVDNKIIRLDYDKYKKESRSTLDFIRLNYDNEAILYFIQKNLTDYLDLIEEDNELFDYEEALSLINKPVDDDSAIRLLKCTDNPVSIYEQNFSPAVMVYVLEYNFDTNDLTGLINNYQSYEADIQNLIVKQVNNNIDFVSIERSPQALKFIRAHCDGEIALKYLQTHIADYLNLISEETELFNFGEALQLLGLELSDDDAINLLSYTNEPVSVIKYSFSSKIMAYVLEYNFNKDDLVNLIKDYDKHDEDIQSLIVEQSIKNCELIVIKQKTDIADNLLNKLFISEKLGENKKIDLFIQALPYKYMHVSERRQALKSMQLDEFNKIWNRGTPKIKCCEDYSRLLLALKEQGLIQDFCVDNKQEKYYRITKRNG